jgi:hypothetical protein
MAFNRKIKTRSGTYYARVENYREGGKVHQRYLKYLGTSPNTIEIPLEPALAGPIAEALMSGTLSSKELKQRLKDMGIEVKGRIQRIKLDFNPPRKRLTLRIE